MCLYCAHFYKSYRPVTTKKCGFQFSLQRVNRVMGVKPGIQKLHYFHPTRTLLFGNVRHNHTICNFAVHLEVKNSFVSQWTHNIFSCVASLLH